MTEAGDSNWPAFAESDAASAARYAKLQCFLRQRRLVYLYKSPNSEKYSLLAGDTQYTGESLDAIIDRL